MPSFSPARSLPVSSKGGDGILLALSLCTLLVHFLTSWRYGYFGDELYFIACGDHLAWGYVDQPPLIAFIARFTRVLLGDSVFAIHFFPAVAHAALVFMTGWTARQLGGDRFAQLLAALSALMGAGFLFTGTVLTMNASSSSREAARSSGRSSAWWWASGCSTSTRC
jgi:hypothetical protein